jgi:hypothetical protein
LPTFAIVHGESKTIGLAITILAVLIFYSGLLWRMKFISPAFAGWSSFHLLLLLLALVAFYKRDNTVEIYTRLRFRTKVVCAFYGAGMLAILAGKL